MRALESRVTRGRFDNGRMPPVPFTIYEKAPNQRALLIGTQPIGAPQAGGRGFDGVHGWDKNVIGTGLRDVTGRELEDLAREAHWLAPIAPADGCAAVTKAGASGENGEAILECEMTDKRTVRLSFAAGTGLLLRRDVDDAGFVRTATFSDYRAVDGVQLPFRSEFKNKVVLVTYFVDRIEHNVPIEDKVFAKPAR